MTLLKRRPGFTVVEAMVAIMIATGAVILGASAMASALDARSTTTTHASATLRAAALREQLTIWLTGAHTPEGRTDHRFIVRDRDGDGFGDEITFITNDATPLADGQVSVTLQWRAQNEQQQLFGLLSRPDSPTQVDTVLISNWVGRMEVQVLPDVTSEWIGNWSSAVMLPIAVSIRLHSASIDSMAALVATPIVVSLRVSQ